MFGSGVRIGITAITRMLLQMDQPGFHHLAPSGSTGAVAGATTAAGSAVRRIATATTRRTGSASWAFALRGLTIRIFTILPFIDCFVYKSFLE